MRLKHVVEIEGRPQDVWPYLEEPEKMKSWLLELVDILPDGPETQGVGTRFKMRLRELGKVAEYQGEVRKYDPPRLLGHRLTGGSFKANEEMFGDYELSDLGGRTRLEYRVEKELEGWVLKALTPLILLLAKARFNGMFKRLKKAVETGGVRAAA